MLSEEELKDAKLLVLANKQDSPAALPVAEVSLQLGLDNLKDRTWSVRGCSAIREDGQLNEALNWLVYAVFICVLHFANKTPRLVDELKSS